MFPTEILLAGIPESFLICLVGATTPSNTITGTAAWNRLSTLHVDYAYLNYTSGYGFVRFTSRHERVTGYA